MDLFDTTAYFSSKVPVLAATKPLLKSAVCALSAKHLRHICHAANQTGESPNSLSNYSRLPLRNEDMWQYHSAKQYDQALRSLKTAIDLGTYDNSPSNKEEMLAAVAILCAFELMDAPGSAWRAHLSALPLFSDGDMSLTDNSTIIIPRTSIKGPIFWSLARQDLLCAFISETQTRLDLKDMRLWQNAGVVTDEHGTLLSSNPQNIMDIQDSSGFEEDTKANELTWILGKIANHLTAGDALIPDENELPRGQRPSIGLTQEHLSDRWNLLMAELENWYGSLPPIFRVTARTRELGQPNPRLKLSFRTFEQIWFDLPICAATVQSYHQAKILMYANEPQESTAIRSTVSSRLRSYRHALSEAIYHARQICGISLANSTDSVRINSVQALFVAGQVFEDQQEQDGVIELLVGIERDLGWTTKYHVSKLTDEWARGRSDNHADRVERTHHQRWGF
ncbi:hypothetical protein N7532_009500 [Penicillium argentinense]|uniref:Uncharacterized protein n=1 Tax=Penicillium argentinense TaxID=1131581 RepID=A0A9W9EZP0_9EURO|nr:uncharacterized protein N7532_009500 [Penicillium argentinense]KAJ5090816.1 hypothetical protein N7532_009500 [Penicillium argentinense]